MQINYTGRVNTNPSYLPYLCHDDFEFHSPDRDRIQIIYNEKKDSLKIYFDGMCVVSYKGKANKHGDRLSFNVNCIDLQEKFAKIIYGLNEQGKIRSMHKPKPKDIEKELKKVLDNANMK